MSKTTIDVCVAEGTDDNTVVVRKSNSSLPIVADVLDIERDEQGQAIKIYLRNLIFNVNRDCEYTGWQPSGVISTILTRIL